MSDMFPDAPRREIVHAPADRVRAAPIARLVNEVDCWTVEDHVCRACLGRILSRVGPEKRVYMCADCGHTEPGATRTAGRIHPSMCACGMRFGARDAGVRCTVNAKPSPELSQAVVASQVE